MVTFVYRGPGGCYSGMHTLKDPEPEKPKAPIVVDQHLRSSPPFISYVDFVPSFVKRPARGRVIYHPFKILVELANGWLRSHPQWKVINCETLTNYSVQDTKEYKAVVKTLRLWIMRYGYGDSDCGDNDDQEKSSPSKRDSREKYMIWYKDYVPSKLQGPQGIESFASLDEVIGEINCTIRNGSTDIKGNIITIETVKCMADASDDTNWSFDPEETYCNEGNTKKDADSDNGNFVSVVRVFYKVGREICKQEIGFSDFVPRYVKQEKSATGEEFLSVIKRTSKWLNENPELSFCSAQSIDMKVEMYEPQMVDMMKQLASASLHCLPQFVAIETDEVDGNESENKYNLNTRSMIERRSSSESIHVRVLRVGFTKAIEGDEEEGDVDLPCRPPPPPPIYLVSEAFAAKKCNNEINDWFAENVQSQDDKYKSRVLSIETIVIPAHINDAKGQQFRQSVNKMVNCDRMEGRFKYSFLGVRLYYDQGYYNHHENEKVDGINENGILVDIA